MTKNPATAAVPPRPIYLVDDEEQALIGLELLLRTEGLTNVVPVTDPRELLPRLAARPASVILLDLFMPHIPGEALLQEITRDYPGVPVIVVTGTDTVATAVRCMQRGAFDYIVKPVDTDRLLPALRHALERRLLEEETRHTRDKMLSPVLEHPERFQHIVTRSPIMFTIFQYIEAIAELPHPVLITGETGVGKELMARTIHDASGRSGAFVSVNVAGLDDTLFSDTLFGHAKGAFTSADGAREGLILRAQGGTLFLDEIGDLSRQSQVKLLRLVQEHEFMAIGSDTPKKTDARIITTTNANLEALQLEDKFRRDLYYRLNAHRINVPPLRQHKEDIPLLVEHFARECAQELGRAKLAMPPEVIALLASYAFPGNVRELRSLVLDIVTRSKLGVAPLQAVTDKLGPAHVPAEFVPGDGIVFPPILPSLKEAADMLMAEAMRRTHGNKSAAARLLNISQQAVSKRWKTKHALPT